MEVFVAGRDAPDFHVVWGQLEESGFNLNGLTFPRIPGDYPFRWGATGESYDLYLHKDEWRILATVAMAAVAGSEAFILCLPAREEDTALLGLAVALKKITLIVGHPKRGQQNFLHLWADEFVEEPLAIVFHLANQQHRKAFLAKHGR